MAKKLQQPKVRLGLAIAQLVLCLIQIIIGIASLTYKCAFPTFSNCPNTYEEADEYSSSSFPCPSEPSGAVALTLGFVGIVSPILAIVNFMNMRPPFLGANLTCDSITSLFSLIVGIVVVIANEDAKSLQGHFLCSYSGGQLVGSEGILNAISAFAFLGLIVNLASLGLDSYEMHMLRIANAFYCCNPEDGDDDKDGDTGGGDSAGNTGGDQGASYTPPTTEPVAVDVPAESPTEDQPQSDPDQPQSDPDQPQSDPDQPQSDPQ